MDIVSVIVATRSFDKEGEITNNTGIIPAAEVIIVKGNNPSLQRNMGVAETKGEILYFLDDDSIPDPGNIDKALAVFKSDDKIAVVGGPSLTSTTEPPAQRAFGAALASVWASGKSCNRYKKSGLRRETTEKELILCNIFIRKDVFNGMQGFKEELHPNEENEFLNRIQAGGYKLIYDPAITVSRPARPAYKDFIKQCFTYGRGRAEQIMIGFNRNDLVNFVPAFFVFYLFMLALGGWRDLLSLVPLLVYMGGTIYFACKEGAVLNTPYGYMRMLINLPALHVSYGVGFMWGLIKYVTGQRKEINREIEIKKVNREK